MTKDEALRQIKQKKDVVSDIRGRLCDAERERDGAIYTLGLVFLCLKVGDVVICNNKKYSVCGAKHHYGDNFAPIGRLIKKDGSISRAETALWHRWERCE